LACFQVTITPNGAWGGEGSLGCGIGYGYLHRIPVDNVVLPPEPAITVSQGAVPKRRLDENPINCGGTPTTTVMPMVPPMMSSPMVGTMPPPPTRPVASPILPPPPSTRPIHPSAPPPSSATSVSSDYAPPSILGTEGGVPLFGTTAPLSGGAPLPPSRAPPLMFTMPPENMVIPDPAMLAGMPIPPPAPMVTNFNNLSISGTTAATTSSGTTQTLSA
jgi:hypothetical protein